MTDPAQASSDSTGDAPFIELRGLSKSLGGRVILRDLSLEVRRGETLVILGASGSGKSVTLRHMVGLLNPDAGRVLIEGVDVTDYSDKQFMAVRHKVDYIFFGFTITVLGFLLAIIFFGLNSSAAQILSVSLLLTPAILRLLRKEEMIARKEGIKHIYRNHKNIFEIYIFILLGVFAAFFLIQLIAINFPESFNQIFSYQISIISSYRQTIH